MTPITHPVSRRSLLKRSLAVGGLAAVSPAALSPIRAQPATPSAAPSTGDGAALFRELGERIVAEMAERGVPGVAVGVVSGEAEYTAGFGVTSLTHPSAVDVDTLFQIGSTSKTYTGTALMRLVEAGTLDLEAPVRSYLPEFRVADEGVSREVTVRHLATHTAGWYGDDFTDTGDGDDALARYVEGMADLAQIAPLGQHLSYNNAAISALGRVIEVAAGQPFEAAVAELVLAPLGLERSFFFTEQIMTEEFAVGHAPSPDDPSGATAVVKEWALPRSVAPAGGVISSVADQLRYARFHLGDGTVGGARVLDAATLRRMQRPLGPGGSLGPSVLDGVGVTWLLTTMGGVRVVMHGGSTYGQQSSFVMAPDEGFAVTVLTNSDAGAILAEKAATWALELFLGVPTPTVVPIVAAPERLAEYEGEYAAIPELVVSVGAEGGGLTISASQAGQAEPILAGPLPLVDEDLASLDVGGLSNLVDFVRDDEGDVAWMRFSGRLYPRLS